MPIAVNYFGLNSVDLFLLLIVVLEGTVAIDYTP